jgi:hypothetical protein
VQIPQNIVQIPQNPVVSTIDRIFIYNTLLLHISRVFPPGLLSDKVGLFALGPKIIVKAARTRIFVIHYLFDAISPTWH